MTEQEQPSIDDDQAHGWQPIEKLTPRQAEALGILRAHQRDQGIPITHRELAKAMGYKAVGNATIDILRVLERKGFIRQPKSRPVKARTIQLVLGWAPSAQKPS